MHTTTLRKVGGSVMMAIPPALLKLLSLEPSAEVGLSVEDGRLVVEAVWRPRYTLAELLAERAEAPPPAIDEEWLSEAPAGRELL